MTYLKYSAILLTLGLLLPLSALAKDSDHGSMQLIQPAWIGSTQLQPGRYKVDWNGNGPMVTVNVMKGNKTVATTSATLKTNDQGVNQDAVVIAPAKNNGKKVVEIDFGKDKEALLLNPGGQQPAGGE